MKLKKLFKMTFLFILIFIVLLILIVGSFLKFAPQVGAKSIGERLKRIENSPNFVDGKFQNPIETPMSATDSSTWKGMIKYFKGNEERAPNNPLPTVKFDKTRFEKLGASEPVISWLGHSTVLIKLEGTVFITDPVFSKRASMVSFFGPKRFDYENQIKLTDLPKIDVVIISHDHYDHLDYGTIEKLHPQVSQFFIPLGVAAHLEKWGVPSNKIIELDWWEEVNFGDKFKLVATPTRHFSGRGITDRFKTLWCSWVIQSENYRLFYGGDSGYFPGFKEIGEKYGPFDLTMLECGAYSIYWSTIHMMPEENVQAHIDLKGKILMPIHWGKFNLSIHSWTEPIERLLNRANFSEVKVATPPIAESWILSKDFPKSDWWNSIKN